MRNSSLVLAGAASVAALVSGGPRVAADTFSDPYVMAPQGMMFSPRIDVFFPSRPAPRPAHVVLVESGVPVESARRFRVRLDRVPATSSTIGGRVLGRLAPDTAYDVLVVDPRFGVPYATLPHAFTARAPRFAELPTTAAARGETVYAHVEFLPRTPRFKVNGILARTTFDSGGDYFGFEMPGALPPGAPTSVVTAQFGGFAVDAPTSLAVLDEPREFSALVAGTRRSSTYETYVIADGRTSVFGRTSAVKRGRYAGQDFFVSVPADVSALRLPATFTQTDGAEVSWNNKRRQGAWLPGPHGWFVSESCTVTVESFDAGRIRGTFSAHVGHAQSDELVASGNPFDVEDGRFSVDAAQPRFTPYGDPYGVR